jgi:hypothetical protein
VYLRLVHVQGLGDGRTDSLLEIRVVRVVRGHAAERRLHLDDGLRGRGHVLGHLDHLDRGHRGVGGLRGGVVAGVRQGVLSQWRSFARGNVRHGVAGLSMRGLRKK